MTTTHAPRDTVSRPALVPVAAATLAGSLLFTAFGTVLSPESDGHGWSELLIIGAFSVVAVALVFALVARAQDGPRAGGIGLALGVAALASVLVFWAGITPALGAGAVLLGLATRRTGQGSGVGMAAVACGALGLAGYVAIYVADWVAQL